MAVLRLSVWRFFCFCKRFRPQFAESGLVIAQGLLGLFLPFGLALLHPFLLEFSDFVVVQPTSPGRAQTSV
jgi:hypothetical protein